MRSDYVVARLKGLAYPIPRILFRNTFYPLIFVLSFCALATNAMLTTALNKTSMKNCLTISISLVEGDTFHSQNTLPV
jgi:hypothetical protein